MQMIHPSSVLLDDQSLYLLLREKTGSPLVESVWNGKFYTAAAEIPFNEKKHAGLRDIGKRLLHEKQLSGELRSLGIAIDHNDVIIDVPEKISFETGLYVHDEKRYFAESSSAFRTETLDSFVKTLYTIRIFVNPDFHEIIETHPKLYDILCDEKRW